MGKRQRVVLYGDSLVLAGMGASLKTYPGIELICLAAQPPAEVRQLWALRPAVVILDLGAVPPDLPVSLLGEQPELLLIGMDAAGDKLLVLSGRQARAVTTADLVQVIEAWPGSTRQLPLWQAHLDRLSQLVSARVAMLRARPRRQKLALALSAITVCALLALVVWLAAPPANAPLSGTALGGLAPEVGLAFAGGILLGFLLLGLGLRWYGSWRNTK